MRGAVGILAYGSLIGDPGAEIEPVIIARIPCYTPFPVEFARQSRSRESAPTLVPSAGGSSVKAQILVVALDVREATDRLYRREIHAVGSARCYVSPKRQNADRVVVETLLDFEGLATVLYTNIGANIPHPTATGLAQLAISSARTLGDGSDGISYLDNAMKAGIETPLTGAYAAEILRLSGGRDLGDAVARIRGEVRE